MTTRPIVCVTRRLPPACEARLSAEFAFRAGDDAATSTAASLAAHADGASALIVTPIDTIDAAAVATLPSSIRVISTFSVGYEHIDVAAATSRGIVVTNTPGVLTDATAEIAMVLMLAAARRAGEGERLMRRGEWTGWRPTQLLGIGLAGKTLGIVGWGRIGQAVAARARSFGMSILFHTRTPPPETGAGFQASLDGLLGQSDIVSLHCPLTPATRHLIDARRIAAMKDRAILINTARGPLVVDDDLIAALTSGKLAAAGLDVFTGEPAFDPRYARLENVVLLPHLGSATAETRLAMGMLAIDNVAAVLSGRAPPHPVTV
ncbi:MAG: D-glycerate dehydrogenase [Rhodospirillaceae bacterium]|nr:D-glycerate dehydrogenase [Rhodospirillaceae bacterium]